MIGRIISYFNTPITVRRTTEATTFVNGLAQLVTSIDTFHLNGVSVQPLTGRERELLPEGIRDRELKKIYSRCPLLSIDVQGKVHADRIDDYGQEYVVQSVENWDRIGGYYKVIIIKEND